MSEYMASKMDDLIESGKIEYEQMDAEIESLRERVAVLEEENTELRAWRDDAFMAHPNLDRDIELLGARLI